MDKAFRIDLFPIAVHVIKTTGWENYKGYLLDAIKNEKNPECRPKADFYTDFGQEQPWVDRIWGEFLEPQMRPFIEGTNTKLQDIWSQQYIDQASHGAHRHQPVGYSCVLYAGFDPEHHGGTTIFRPYLDANDTLNGQDCFTPKVEEGDILVFPSWILHEIRQSSSKKPRTIIAFNLEPITAE